MKLLMPCECGRNVEVSPSQCGQKVRCTCGKELTILPFRELQNLQQLRHDGELENLALDSAGLENILRVAKAQGNLIASVLALFVFFASVFASGRIGLPISPKLFWILLWAIGIFLGWSVFRIVSKTNGHVLAGILFLLALLPFLFVVAAAIAMYLGNRYIRNAGYGTWILGIRTDELKRLADEIRSSRN